MIIDFHTHTFPDRIAKDTIHKLSDVCGIQGSTDGTENELLNSMKVSGVDYSVTLPVATNIGQVEKINRKTVSRMEELLNLGIIPFGCIHPDYENYKNELRFLKENGIRGIKIHPAYQGVELSDLRNMRIIAAAAELDMTVITHGGFDPLVPDHNYSPVEAVLKILREIAPAKFVVAHMGGIRCWDQVEKELCGAPVYLDTAVSIGKPNIRRNLAWAKDLPDYMSGETFAGIAKKHGIGRILFGTDCPWSSQKYCVDLIHSFPLEEKEINAILYENAKKLLNL